MGLSSSKSKQTSTQTIAPTAYAQPYVDSAAATLKPGYDESMKAAQTYQPGLLAASNYYGDVMGGKYLDSNPYIDQIVQDSNSDITDTVNSQFNSRFGSGYHAKALAKQLGANEAALRGGNYATERGYQDQAGRNMAGIATVGTTLPMIPSQGYSQGVGGLLGRYMQSDGTNVTKSSPSIMQMLGQAAQAAALFV